jgi:ABC-type polysaccharide/polyol phosphate transport system ATPase subunit
MRSNKRGMRMEQPIIKFVGVNKSYRIFQDRHTTLKEKIIKKITLSKDKEHFIEKKVLENFGLEIYQGETVGIIGENGAGKSTTLKLIAQIIEPDQGTLTVNGKVASLLEIGAGFQADMTGKENVYLNGTILGLSKRDIDNKYEDIVEFAELKDFMNTPVKNYSSGMYMRLAFAVAIHVDPEIILIDEVLAVGDFNFQKKCMNKLEELKQKGKTIIFVSHDMTSVRQLCSKVVYIYENGSYKIGPAEQMVNMYFTNVYKLVTKSIQQNTKIENEKDFSNGLNQISASCMNPNKADHARWGNESMKFEEVLLGLSNGTVSNVFQSGQDIIIHAKFNTNQIIDKAVVGIAVYDEQNNLLSGPNSKDDGIILEQVNGESFIKIILKNPPFLDGTYYLTVALYDYSCRQPFDHLEKFFIFHVQSQKPIHGKVKLDCDWIF